MTALTLFIVIKSLLINKAKHFKLKCNKLARNKFENLKFIPAQIYLCFMQLTLKHGWRLSEDKKRFLFRSRTDLVMH